MDDPFFVYAAFNVAEGLAWIAIAAVLPVRIKSRTAREKTAVALAAVGFVLFGITDFLEAPRQGQLPGWLWLAKIACAGLILSCRFIYLGWDKFHWKDRFVVFGLCGLGASFGVMALQRWLYPP